MSNDMGELLRQIDTLRQGVLQLHEQMQSIPGPDRYRLSIQIPRFLKTATAINRAATDAQGSVRVLNSLWNHAGSAQSDLDSCLTDGQYLYELKPETRTYFEAMQRIRRRLAAVADNLDKAAAALRELGVVEATPEAA